MYETYRSEADWHIHQRSPRHRTCISETIVSLLVAQRIRECGTSLS